LTASRAREQSFEVADLKGGHGVFTYFVVQGMEGAADTSGDGVVTADELAEYVHSQVREYTGNKQNPTSDKANYDPEMLLAYVPSRARPASAPAPKFGTLVFESNMDGVEVFVDGKTIGVLEKGKPVSAPGLAPGEHTVQGVKMGYEPDGPRQEMVYPGQESPVKISILIPRRRNKAAADLLQEGMKFYHKGNELDYKRAVALFERALAAEPHLWLADSLRLSGKFAEARPMYDEYLKLSDFDSKLAGKLNYYVLGSLVGMGRKKRVAERDIWNDYHNMAWYGMCECERKAANLDTAIADCQKALTYDAKDPKMRCAAGKKILARSRI